MSVKKKQNWQIQIPHYLCATVNRILQPTSKSILPAYNSISPKLQAYFFPSLPPSSTATFGMFTSCIKVPILQPSSCQLSSSLRLNWSSCSVLLLVTPLWVFPLVLRWSGSLASFRMEWKETMYLVNCYSCLVNLIGRQGLLALLVSENVWFLYMFRLLHIGGQ